MKYLFWQLLISERPDNALSILLSNAHFLEQLPSNCANKPVVMRHVGNLEGRDLQRIQEINELTAA